MTRKVVTYDKADGSLPPSVQAKLDAEFAPLPTGTPNGAQFYRDDGTWAIPASGSGGGLGTALYLPGASTDYVATPITAAMRGASLDVRVLVNLSSAVTGNLIAAGGANASDTCWNLYITSSTIRMRMSGNGTDATTASASTPGGLIAGAWGWVRATVVLGSPSDTTTFYTSTDGATWAQLGTVRTTNTIGAFYPTANPVRIGSVGAGSPAASAGLFQRAEVRDSIGGGVVALWDGRTPTARQRDAAGNVWTVAGTGNAWQIV